MVIYDVGAHVGIHVLYIAKLLNGVGKIYAFEPYPENFDGLLCNLKINRPKSKTIIPINKAIGKENGIAYMVKGLHDGMHHITEYEEKSTLMVDMTTIDYFVSQNVEKPNLILIDVEGYEMNVLLGAENTIKKYSPMFILEHHNKIFLLKNWLQSKGYKIENVGNRHLYALRQ